MSSNRGKQLPLCRLMYKYSLTLIVRLEPNVCISVGRVHGQLRGEPELYRHRAGAGLLRGLRPANLVHVVASRSNQELDPGSVLTVGPLSGPNTFFVIVTEVFGPKWI